MPNLDPKAAVDGARDYVRSRPYHLLPWVMLIAAGALWPKHRVLPPGLSEDRAMTPEAFEKAEPGRGRAATSPLEIPPLGWKDILWRTWRETMRDKLPIVAAGITFYVLLAIFPALGAFVSLYGLFSDVSTVQHQLQDLAPVVPASVLQIIGEQMMRLAATHSAKLTTAFFVSVLISVWSANAGMKVMLEGLNVTYDETEKRDFVPRTAMTYGATFATLMFLVTITSLLVGIPPLLRALGAQNWEVYWSPARWAVVYLVTTTAFAVAYRHGPSRRKARWRWVVVGAVVAALVWMLGSMSFSGYINHATRLDATYGPLGAVIAFMLWVWFSIMVLLLGAELNAEIEHQTACDSTTGEPMPMGQRGAAMADTVGQPFSFRGAVRYAGGVVRRQTTNLWGHASRIVRRGSPPATPDEPPGPPLSTAQLRRPAPPPP
ncbi:MAG TPA: YihY/virulence factor BrkB family protein [Caulobacteraceae bacterium]